MEERILSGIRPSSRLHIGNYLGAIRQWIELQHLSRSFFMIADLHAITTPYDPKGLQQAIRDVALDYLAAGLDHHKASLFVQSHVPEHVELAWLLGTLIPFGELARMTQWKEKSGESDKQSASFIITRLIEQLDAEPEIMKIYRTWQRASKKTSDVKKRLPLYDLSDELEQYGKPLVREYELHRLKNVTAGLLNYPVLMAADILIYKATGVPVGEDQLQHVELARTIAKKFNTKYGETFPEPKALLSRGKRIMSLLDPTKKMSKSDGTPYRTVRGGGAGHHSMPSGSIQLDDPADAIKKKVMKAVTATKGGAMNQSVHGGDGNPGVINLFVLLKEFSDPTTYRQFMNAEETGTIKYAELKAQLAEDIARHFDAFRKRRAELASNNRYLDEILTEGAHEARIVAKKTLEEVKKRMGLL